ncbi:MAG TPA: hypothetical protein VMT95_03175 [Candidatus Binatia bacterium]|nr:hypothetical protein [Candidatus Binatia bacterium]
MQFLQLIRIVAVAIIAMVGSAGVATAHSYYGSPANMMFPLARGYSGNWPVTISHSQFDNGTDCLTLNGSGNGGSASLVTGRTKYPYGSFLVLNGILVVNITEPLYGQNGSLFFIAPASRGHIGTGVFEDDRGGSSFDAGDLTFGAKNGC